MYRHKNEKSAKKRAFIADFAKENAEQTTPPQLAAYPRQTITYDR